MQSAPPQIYVLYAGCYLSGRHTSVRYIIGNPDWHGDRVRGPFTVGSTTYEMFVQIARFRSFDPSVPIDQILEQEGVRREFEFLRKVETIVFVVDPTREGGNEDMLEVVRKDLAAAGRNPVEIPVVFQINKQDLIASGDAPSVDRSGLNWPISDYIESTAVTGAGFVEALSRAIELVVTQKAQ
jgi:hypothetical protein